MSDAPRTNRVTRARSEIASTSVVDADFARTLERELAAAKAEIERLREAVQHWQHMHECAQNANAYRQAAIDAGEK